MQSGNKANSTESTSSLVKRRLRRFALLGALTTLILCLAFLVFVTRSNSSQMCTAVGINIQSYLESLSREIVIGNKAHISTILEELKRSELLKQISLGPANINADLPQNEQCTLNGFAIEFMAPIKFGHREVGTLQGQIAWLPFSHILTFFGIAGLLSLIFMLIATRFLLDDLQKILITPINKLARGEDLGGYVCTTDVLAIKQELEASRENAKYAAIAQLTQMLAHDVRKPFSMIQIAMQNAAAAQTIYEMKSIVNSSSEEINRALITVTAMLSDIMEIGQNSIQSKELVSPKTLVNTTMHEMARLHLNSDIEFDTLFNHQYLLDIDPAKVQRVFSNVAENALQAMEGKGRIWFRTKPPDEHGFVEIVIGNSGKTIPKEDIDRIFEAFFTKGKNGGTGLGLAIAKKIVSAHGGQISCDTSQKSGPEFCFTLPCSKIPDDLSIALPVSTRDIQKTVRRTMPDTVDEFSDDRQEIEYTAQIMQKLRGCRIKILVLDDEELYRNAIVRLLQKLDRVGSSIDVLVAASCCEALGHALSQPMVGLFDYDLGAKSLNGIETLKLMRQRVPDICICIHSNQICGIQYAEAVNAGAQHFLPKPISKVHLLRIINDSLTTRQKETSKIIAADKNEGLVAVLDDCNFVRVAWKHMNQGRPVITFESPEAFWRHANQHPNFLESLKLIVTDQNFGNLSKQTGIEFATTIIDKPVFLATASDLTSQLPIHGIAGILPKKVMEWDELHAACSKFNPST